MDIKKLIFDQIKDQFTKGGIEVDELNLMIDFKKNEARMSGFLNDKEVINELIEKKELSMLQRLFAKKIEKKFLTDHPDSTIDKIYIYIKLQSEKYYVYIYYDGSEMPIEIDLYQ